MFSHPGTIVAETRLSELSIPHWLPWLTWLWSNPCLLYIETISTSSMYCRSAIGKER